MIPVPGGGQLDPIDLKLLCDHVRATGNGHTGWQIALAAERRVRAALDPPAPEPMRRGATAAETCKLNGWTVGTRLVSDEHVTIRITAIGVRRILAVNEEFIGSEALYSLALTEWREVIDPPPATVTVRADDFTWVVTRLGAGMVWLPSERDRVNRLTEASQAARTGSDTR